MTEGWTLLCLMLALVAGVFVLRLPTGLALVLAAVAGALVAGEGVPIRHIVEGTMLYLDPILVVITSLFFMAVITRSGLLASANVWAVRRLGHWPALLLLLLAFFVMLPGMLTGLTAPCVLTTGAMVAPLLIGAGVPRARAGAFIAVAAFGGMVAPPVNIAAMIIGSGVDMPYIGFTWPLLIASVPLVVICSFMLVGKHLRQIGGTATLAQLPPDRFATHGVKLLLPLLLILVLLIGSKSLPRLIPDVGVPFMFVAAAVVGLFTGDRVNLRETLAWTVKQSAPIVGLLAGIGVFIQILTLTGARGFISVNTLLLPSWLLVAGGGVLVPLFGGISAYGASGVLGVPLLLAMLHRNDIIVAAALSLLASVGDFLPPTRLAVILAGPVVDENPNRVLRYCWIPALMAIAWGIAMILLANPLGKLLSLA